MSTIQRFRPSNTRERAELSRQLSIFDPAAAGAETTQIVQSRLIPHLMRWEDAEAQVGQTAQAVEAARLAVAAADEAWDAALTSLSWTLKAPSGAPVPLGSVMGVSLSVATAAAPDRGLELADVLLKAIEVGKVQADAAALAAFAGASSVLNKAIAVRGDALRARITAVAAEEEARDGLDLAASQTARALDAMVGPGTAKRWLPTFARAAKADPKPAEKPTETKPTETAGAPAAG